MISKIEENDTEIIFPDGFSDNRRVGNPCRLYYFWCSQEAVLSLTLSRPFTGRLLPATIVRPPPLGSSISSMATSTTAVIRRIVFLYMQSGQDSDWLLSASV